MDPLSTRVTPDYNSGAGKQRNWTIEGPGSNYNSNFHSYHINRDEGESDTDIDSFEGMPEGWHAAQSPENDTYYVSPITPGSGGGTTTWIKPMLSWAPADVSFREELAKTFKVAIQPEPGRSDCVNVHDSSSAKTGQDYYAGVEARASRLDVN